MFNARAVHVIGFLFALLAMPLPAFALAQLSISSPAADGVFVVQGANLDGVSGLDLSISFDSNTLSNPRVAMGPLGSGMMSAVNPGNPVRIAIVGTGSLKGSGTVATITFDRSGDAPGAITSVTASAIDRQARKVAMAQPVVVNPTLPAASNSGGSNGSASSVAEVAQNTPATSGARPFIVGGSVTLPAGDLASPAEKRDVPAPLAQQEKQDSFERQRGTIERPEAGPAGAEVAAKSAEAAPAPAPLKIEGVLERFKLFQGEKTPRTLTALFKAQDGAFFTQSPAVAISDGKSSVALAITKVTGDKAPKFTFTNAKFLSLSHGDAGEWTVEVVPDKGAVQVAVTMLLNGVQQEFPLTVTPSPDRGGLKPAAATEADFILFLKDRGTAAAPRFDLNGDGKRDYVDDYIYTAHYLLAMEEKEKQKKTAQQKGK